MCNSPWHDKFWCFVTEDSQCGDGGRSEAENWPWSYKACENGGMATPCVCSGAQNGNKEGGDCTEDKKTQRKWCYVLKTANCQETQESDSKPDTLWSYNPCGRVEVETAVGDFKVSAKDRPSDNESRFPGYYSRLQRRWAPSDPFPSYLFEH